MHILARRSKNNPILIGEPGVGKTAIVEGLAHRIVNGDVPEDLREKDIYSLDMGALIAGAKFQGEFEERLKGVIKEVTQAEGQIFLFIDDNGESLDGGVDSEDAWLAYFGTDFELDISEQTNLIIGILKYAGVIINDPTVIQVAQQEQQKELQNEKS